MPSSSLSQNIEHFANNQYLYRMSTPTTTVDAPVKEVTGDIANKTANDNAGNLNIPSTSANNVTADSVTLNSGVVSTIQDVEIIGETEDVTFANQASNLGKRKAGVQARENISAAIGVKNNDIYALESSDDEKPLKKRARSTSVSNTVLPPGKAARRGSKGVYIGFHTLDPQGRLPVYAVYYPNGPLNCRVFHEDCSEDVQAEFAAFFSTKAQAKMECIQLDEALFPHVPKKKTSSADEKKQHIRDFLATKGIYPPGQKGPDCTSASNLHAPTSQPSLSTKVTTSASLSNTRLPPTKGKAPASSTNVARARPSKRMKTDPLANGASDLSPRDDGLVLSAPFVPPVKKVCVDYSSDMNVGFWKINGDFHVYAFLTNTISPGKIDVAFRLHFTEIPEERRNLPGILPASETLTFAEVDFKDGYSLESDEATKSYIKSVLEAKNAEKKQKAMGK